jgi:hypothetical protein
MGENALVDDGMSGVAAYAVMDGRIKEVEETSDAIERVAVDAEVVAVRSVVTGATRDLKRPANGVIRGMLRVCDAEV